MDKMPLISVVMSVYKEPLDWLNQSIDSILCQTFSEFEFIIICDNPSYKEGIDLLEAYKKSDNRIVLIYNEQNIGLTKSLNKGLAIAKGEYIARMDADDISMPKRFEVQVNYMEAHPEVDVCGMGIRMFGNKNLFSQKAKYFASEHDDIVTYMMFENPFAHPAVLFRRVINQMTVKYDEGVLKAQDYHLWFDLYKCNACFYNIHDVGLKYRVSDRQISSSSTSGQKLIANDIRNKILKEYLPSVNEDEEYLHNEICNIIKSDIDIRRKKQWLLYLRSVLAKKSKLHCAIEDKLFTLWIANCMVYADKKGFWQYPNKNIKIYLKPIVLNSFIKMCFRH